MMRNGPSYLPQNSREWALWLSAVLLGALGGRIVMVHCYHLTHR